MSQKAYVKCLDCGTSNLNNDYCTNCGSLINIVLKREMEREKKLQKEIELKKGEKPNKIDEFLRKMTAHPNDFVRFFSQIIYAAWLFCAMVVGGLIAAVVGIAAG